MPRTRFSFDSSIGQVIIVSAPTHGAARESVLSGVLVRDHRLVFSFEGPTSLLPSNEAINCRVQGGRHTRALCLACNRATEKIRLGWRLLAHIGQHRRR